MKGLKIQKNNIVYIIFEIFFILSFAFVTYASNIYVLWGIIFPGLLLLVSKQINKIPIVFVLFFLMLIPLYNTLYGFEGGYRVLKTFAIFIPFFVLERCKDTPSDIYKIMKPFHYFMCLSAILVCLDFFLFFTLGRTIMTFTDTGFLPRPNGLMEDSNFFCYSMVCYIMFLKCMYRKSTKLFIISIFLSGSFSAIVILLLMLFIYKRTQLNTCEEFSSKWYKVRILIIVSVLFIHSCYYLVVDRKDNIINYIEQLDMPALMKIKAISMFHRFSAQKEAIDYLADSNLQLLGGGPGITKTLNKRGMNLHNTYYQIYIEMGIALLLLTVSVLLYYMFKIRNLYFLLLFGVMSLFGNMLEVYYYPILPFVFFLYKIYSKRVLILNEI